MSKRFQRVVLKLTKGVNDVARFPIKLSNQIYNAVTAEVECVHFQGLANAGGDPTTKLISINFGLPHGIYETITDAESNESWYVPISAAPNYLVTYPDVESRKLNEFNVHDGSQIRTLTVKMFDETNAATRESPQFTGCTIILRFLLRNEVNRIRDPLAADQSNTSLPMGAPGDRTQGYRFF